MNQRHLLAGLLGALLTPLALPLTGCLEGRLPVCKTNTDCQQRDAGKPSNVCVSLRCVECQYDSDCAVGSVCGRAGTCSALDPHHRRGADGGPDEIRSWDPVNWNECATGCKDEDCLASCDRRFHAK